jgi:hypothetical protein
VKNGEVRRDPSLQTDACGVASFRGVWPGCGGRILSGVKFGYFRYLIGNLNNGRGVIFGYHMARDDGSDGRNGPRVIFTFSRDIYVKRTYTRGDVNSRGFDLSEAPPIC